MNFLMLLNWTLAGFLVSLVLATALRALMAERWPVQNAGFRIERRAAPWLLAFAAGPALFFDATARYRRREAGTKGDLAIVLLLLGIWSLSYGLCLRAVADLVI